MMTYFFGVFFSFNLTNLLAILFPRKIYPYVYGSSPDKRFYLETQAKTVPSATRDDPPELTRVLLRNLLSGVPFALKNPTAYTQVPHRSVQLHRAASRLAEGCGGGSICQWGHRTQAQPRREGDPRAYRGDAVHPSHDAQGIIQYVRRKCILLGFCCCCCSVIYYSIFHLTM